MPFFTDPSSGFLLVDKVSGLPIEDSTCCCDTTPVTPCCTEGETLHHVYCYAYASSGAFQAGPPDTNPGCLPFDCDDIENGAPCNNGAARKYRDAGKWSHPTFNWNAGDFNDAGSCGCFDVRIHGSCVDNQFKAFINMDFGYGPVGDRQLDATYDSEQCVLMLGCFNYSPGGFTAKPTDVSYLLTLRDPATGILVPDGSVVQTRITFNLTLVDGGGTPTVYSCQLWYAPLSPESPNNTCWTWIGYLVAQGCCYLIELDFLPDFFGAGLGAWLLQGFTCTGIHDGHLMYNAAPFPVMGNMVDTWTGCDGSTSVMPPWSLSNP